MQCRSVRISAPLAALLLAVIAFAQPAAAQDAGKDAVQVKLSDAMVKGYIAAKKDIAAMSGKLKAAGKKPDPKLEAELEGIAKKHGFKSYDELEDVGFTVSLVMDGFDSGTGAFREPKEQLAKELAGIKADKSMPAAEKKQLVADLEETIKTTPPLQHKENVDVVKKNLAAIEKATD
jgi:hypothetical protein